MGAGGAKSRNSVDVVNDAIVNAVLQSANNCGAHVTQTQEVVYSGTTIGSTVRQTMNLNMQCLQNVQVNNDLVYQIANSIKQEAAASRITLVDPFTKSKAVNDQSLRNYLSTTISTQTLQNCATTADQTQRAIFGGITVGAVQEQSLDLYVKCLTETLNKNNVAANIVADTSQQATSSEATGFTIGGFSWVIWVILLLVLVVLAAAAYFLWPSSETSSSRGGSSVEGPSSRLSTHYQR